MNQESRDRYGDESTEGATEISQGEDKLDGADEIFEEAHTDENMFDVACAEEIVARANSQRVRNLYRHVTETNNERNEDEEE